MSIKLSSSFALGALAALVMAVTPADAQTRGRRQAAEPAADPAQVQADAQTAIAAAGVVCSVSEAKRLGVNDAGTAYEVACESGPGYLLISGETTQAFNCLALAVSATEEGAAQCTLERNLDALATIRPLAQASNVSCAIDQAAWIGQLPSGEDRYEIGCAGSEGYWIDVPKTAAAASNVIPCLEVAGARTCQFTTPQEQTAWIAAKYPTIGSGCVPAQVRVAGANQQAKFYEVKCESGDGYFLRTLLADGALDRAIPCIEAVNIGGGCTFVDTSAALAEASAARAAALSRLAPNCQPGDSRLIGRETTGDLRDVVEFVCAAQPVGVVGFLAASGDSSEVLDCVTATLRRINCQLTTADQVKAAVQSQMDAGNMPCPVREFLVHGRTDDLTGDFIEVKCEDDRSLFGQFPHNRTRAANDVMICARARLLYGYECEL